MRGRVEVPMRGLACLLGALLFAASGQAQSLAEAERRPWEWTLEERLKERLDAVKIRERDAAADPRETAGSSNKTDDIAVVAKDRPFEYRIDGRRNPELFLSFELVDTLLTGLSHDEATRASQRQHKQKAIRSLGYDDQAFWASLE